MIVLYDVIDDPITILIIMIIEASSLQMRVVFAIFTFFIFSVTDCWQGNPTSTTVLPDKPQGVADASRKLLLVGLPFVDGGHGVLARGLEL